MAVAVAAASVASGAFAFNSAPIQFDGRAGQYLHAYHQESDGGYCGAFCNPLAPSTETQVNLATNDILDASGNFTLNNSNRTITCQDASGNGLPHTNPDSNNLETQGGWNYTEGGGRNLALGTGTYVVCSVALGASGKLESGFWNTSAISNVPGLGPIQFDTVQYLDKRLMLTTSACTAPLNLTEAEAVTDFAISVDFDQTAVANYLTSTPLSNSCQVSSWQHLAYLTCDVTYECGQFGKSVPIPAFAAGALGLGLMGVTYLTSRRRRVR